MVTGSQAPAAHGGTSATPGLKPSRAPKARPSKARPSKTSPTPPRAEPRHTHARSAVARLLGGTDDGTVEVRLLDDRVVHVRQVVRELRPWKGPLPADFDLVPEKEAIDVAGTCAYPELAVVAGFRARGWDARWRKTFGGVGWWLAIGRDEALPPEPKLVMARITRKAGQIASARGIPQPTAGIWDVLAWRERKYLFVEVNGGASRDDDRLLWLEAALDLEVPVGAFAVLRYTVARDAR